MSEVQNFFYKNYQKQASKEFLCRSLQSYLQKIQNSLKGDVSSQKDSSDELFSKTSEPCDWKKTGLDRKNEYYEFQSESSDVLCNSSSTSTDDEMAETYSVSESINNGQLKAPCIINNGLLLREDSHHIVSNNTNPHEKMWRPW